MVWTLYEDRNYGWPEPFRKSPYPDDKHAVSVALGAAKKEFDDCVKGLAAFSNAGSLRDVGGMEETALADAGSGYPKLRSKLVALAKHVSKSLGEEKKNKNKAVVQKLKAIDATVAECCKDLSSAAIKPRIAALAQARRNAIVKDDVRNFVDTVALADKFIKGMRRLNTLNVEAGPADVRRVNTDFHKLLADCDGRLRSASRRLRRHLDDGWRVPGLDGGNLDAALRRLPDTAEVGATTSETLRSALNVKHDAARAGWDALNDIADRLA